MEKESPTKSDSSSITRTILVFLFGGFILTVAVNIVYHICLIIWIDFIHYNPHRSQQHALELIAWSPISALFYTLYYSLTLIAGTIVAMISHWIWGRVPFFSLAIILPLCVFVWYKQIPSGPHPFEHIDFFWLFIMQLPVWLGCWWWNNRLPKA